MVDVTKAWDDLLKKVAIRWIDIRLFFSFQTVIGKLLEGFTIVGCTLSVICLIVCIYVFTALPGMLYAIAAKNNFFLFPISSLIYPCHFYTEFTGLRGDRITIHRNLCISLCLAELLLLFGMDATNNSTLCSVIAGVLHFLFLATFAWMLVEGIHVYYMLVKVFFL